MTKTQKNIIWMFVAGFAFLAGNLFGTWTENQRLSQPPQELAVAGSVPVLLQDMVEARATIYMNPKDANYECVKRMTEETASVWNLWFVQTRPSWVRASLRDKTRLYCGQAVTVLIDAPQPEVPAQ